MYGVSPVGLELVNKEQLASLARVQAGDRVLLLPHCLRHASDCKASYDKNGLQCARCHADCAINVLTWMSTELGYKGVCVAPGGRLAVNYIEQSRPMAIVAVACDKELEEGVGNVGSIDVESYRPLIVVIPLSRDGCVDTEVDLKAAIEVLSAGCTPGARLSSPAGPT
jgi:hypothetical protein